MVKKKIIIIGAGPAGLAAALSALKEGTSVLVLEHMKEPGIKLLLTGNGQCNLSNSEVSAEHYHGNRKVIDTVLSGFSYDDMIRFMKKLSVETETVKYRHESCGYLYPADHRSSTVLNRMKERISELGGKIQTGCGIKKIHVLNSGFEIFTDSGTYTSDRLVFATGSNAYPKTGSDSSIYPVLKELGIIQKTWLPALVALRTDPVLLKELKGLRADGEAVLTDETAGRSYHTSPGEIQFREHYISGFPVLQLSRYAAIGLREKHEMILRVHMTKATNKDGTLPFETAEFPIMGTEGFEKAICCSGGIDASDIDPATLESTKYRHLYFAGEMIDVDGDCGGFNLHFAIASGLLAGRNAAG